MWKERVKEELADLKDKIEKLKFAIEQPARFNISARQLSLMRNQYQLMDGYRVVLEQRLEEE